MKGTDRNPSQEDRMGTWIGVEFGWKIYPIKKNRTKFVATGIRILIEGLNAIAVDDRELVLIAIH